MAKRKQKKTRLLTKAGDYENSEISEISGRAFVVCDVSTSRRAEIRLA